MHYLHNEGLFWHAYEFSVYALVVSIKQYFAKNKFIKKVSSKIVFIGFPDSTLVNILDLCKQKGLAVNKSDRLITIELATKKEGFEKWKNDIEITESSKTKR